MGEPQVWVALIFQSDGSRTRAEGTLVDDIVLEKYVPGLRGEAPAPQTGGAGHMPGEEITELTHEVVVRKR